MTAATAFTLGLETGDPSKSQSLRPLGGSEGLACSHLQDQRHSKWTVMGACGGSMRMRIHWLSRV